jgi:hypothetical protein
VYQNDQKLREIWEQKHVGNFELLLQYTAYTSFTTVQLSVWGFVRKGIIPIGIG